MRSRNTKVVLLGESAVGKTSLVYRFCSNGFSDNLLITTGAAFSTKNFKARDKEINFHIWDTAGQEKYRAILPLYYRDSQMAILLFDVHSETTLNQLELWNQQLIDNGPRNISKYNIVQVLVGNKIDISKDYSAVKDLAEKLAEQQKTKLFLISCKTGEGVQDVFQYLAETYLDKLGEQYERKSLQQSTISIDFQNIQKTSKEQENQIKKKNCC